MLRRSTVVPALISVIVLAASHLSAQQVQRGQPGGQNGQIQQDAIQLVAVVNGQSINRDQLAQQCAVRFGEGVLESMINKMLIFDQLQKQQIMITEGDVDNEIQRQAAKYGLSSQKYIELIQKERDVSPDKFKEDIIWMELALRRLAAGKIQVSPEEIARRMQFEYGATVQVRAIASNTREQAEKIHAYVAQNPAEFGKVAKNQSVDTQSAAVRGLIPPIRKNMGEPILENAAFALNEGQISQIIVAGEQFIILKCERHSPPVNLDPQQRTMAEQKVEEDLREEKLGNAAATLFQDLQSTVEITNVYNDPQLRKQHPGVAALVNGSPITLRKLYEECITRFGRDVLKAEINRTIVLQRLQQANMNVADNDVQAEVARAASAYGFSKEDGSVDVDRWLAYVTQGDRSKLDIYIQDEVWPSAAMKKLVEQNIHVTQEDLQKGFEANYGERVECLAIVLNDQRLAHRVWQQAKADPSEEQFGKLAHQYSVEPASRANYGQVPPIKRHSGQPNLEEEAFNLQPGEISGLINAGNTWIILMCQGRTTPRVQQIDAVKDELHRSIMEQKLRIAMAEEFDRITQAAQVDNFLEGTSQPGAGAIQSAREQYQQNSSQN